MINKEIEKFFENIPSRITPSIKMDDVNQIIKVYEGEFDLKTDSITIKLTGTITFNWFPSQGLIFSGTIIENSGNIISLLTSRDTLELILKGSKFGDTIITHASNVIEGIITSKTLIIGDKSISVDKVRFTIPNLRQFLGGAVKETIKESIITSSRSRIIFENTDYKIIIDWLHDYKERFKLLNSKGGYITLYSGELTKKKGSIDYSELRSIFYCFSTFISFLNGRRCSALFIQGIYNNEEKWYDYTANPTDQYKGVLSWPQESNIDGLNELWQNFYSLWKNEENRDFLTTVIHWYNEANSNSGHAQGSIIMTQTALELIYNWLLIENKKMLIGKDSENISASNKIRLLLSQLNAEQEIPNAFIELKALPKIIDGPDAFVQIRNAIVHSQEEKRKRLSEMPVKAIFQARHLGIWYLELSLLYLLNFKAKYSNRTLINDKSGCEVQVPWVR